MAPILNNRLSKSYYNPSQPASFGGVKRLKKSIGKGDVKKWLSYQDAYTLHKPLRHKFRRRPILVGGINHQWVIDLADLSSHSKVNNGNKYIFTCVGVLSRYAWAVPIKNKTGTSTMMAMRKIINQSKRKPITIQGDKGKEFLNSKFQGFLSDNKIAFFSTENDDIKASIVERFNRTLKEKMWRYFTYTRKKKYIDKLQDFVNSYNSSIHRTIGMKPKDVSKENEVDLLDKMYSNIPQSHPPRYKVTDKVRIAMTRRPFQKGYTGKWSQEIFSVVSVLPTSPTTYRLGDLQGDSIDGSFYEQEIQKIGFTKDRLYVVERILKERLRNGQKGIFC